MPPSEAHQQAMDALYEATARHDAQNAFVDAFAVYNAITEKIFEQWHAVAVAEGAVVKHLGVDAGSCAAAEAIREKLMEELRDLERQRKDALHRASVAGTLRNEILGDCRPVAG